MKITRRLEFDAGHRIPQHGSQCRNLHGHRYVLEVSLAGDTVADAGAANEGMVLDFSDIKTIVSEHIVSRWDHAFLVYQGDSVIRDFLESLPGHKTVVVPAIPTAENLARLAFTTLAPLFEERYQGRLRLERVRLYETPNCWADAEAL
ncbi:6-carboxytetrahydropterin synthase QueD [Niveibacterium terrae]|uniref:6-carboxytetrahydropterin synthase QueD n=1 Tax=Niveibacterium terrae TaxID=3373598 RepID=UPI003A91A0BB